ncbi:GIY-YIG nuclease family protein [Luteimonas kalidii]|uniref:GIY-YIG nuclease family protein n=1 Tax=Luteimonas kalidii TaxID=3042025 RepID=A0ABT6JQJ7_9GAMM|nr:GIY-YIG nuclease family protein [Luteimonas kalidii]MDH5832892.1 GIY-YIG nuclease family protein [Luteimonas kalidii]
MPACHLYILPLLHEDIAKVGISVDPLARVRAFSRRYYESFDLDRSLLLAFDSVAEARRRETALHRALRVWRAPAPLTVPALAGGGTEWYRGAWPQLQAEAAAGAAAGHQAWLPADDWWRARLQAEEPRLYEWAEACLRDVPDDAPLPQTHWSRVVDVLDAWPALGLGVAHALPEAMVTRYSTHRTAWHLPLGG